MVAAVSVVVEADMSATAGVAVDWLWAPLLSIGAPPMDGDRLLAVEGWGARV